MSTTFYPLFGQITALDTPHTRVDGKCATSKSKMDGLLEYSSTELAHATDSFDT